MKKIVGMTLSVLVLVIVVTQYVTAGNVQINYFNLYTWQNNQGMTILQGEFYAYEDMSLYLGEMGISYNCGTWFIDEIVDVPTDGVIVNGKHITEAELIDAIAYIAEQLIIYLETGDYEIIFQEYQPKSIYNLDHPSALTNSTILEGYATINQPCNLVYLPIIFK